MKRRPLLLALLLAFGAGCATTENAGTAPAAGSAAATPKAYAPNTRVPPC